MPDPLRIQPARFFEHLPTAQNFEREYEVQNTIPIDGAKASLKAFSPFVMRVLPPLVLGDTFNTLGVSRDRATPLADDRRTALTAQITSLESQITQVRALGPDFAINIPDLESQRDALQAELDALPAEVATSTPRTDYAGAIRGLNQRRSASEATYQDDVNRGTAIPGLSAASARDIDEFVSNSARNQAISRNVPASSHLRIVPALSNDAAALSILLQLKQMMDIPPICLYINPTNFTVSHAKIAQFQERSRYGYIYQAWGEELTKVSFSCQIGAFIAGRGSRTQTGVASGVQYASKRDSASFQQLMSVFGLYQSSGYIQDTTANSTGRRSRANLLVGNTSIEYDQTVYVGHMDSFSYSEEETIQNGGIKFDIEFTAVKVYDVAQPKSSISPENSPSNFYNPSSGFSPSGGSRLSRTFLGTGPTTFLTAPTIGGAPAQPWSGAAVGLPSETGSVITTRRT
jgi:hypothetical protein